MQMVLKGIIDEDFIQYKKASMVVIFPCCTFKCDIDCGEPVCQNGILASSPSVLCDADSIVKRYLKNPITKAMVASGLEPLDDKDQLFALIKEFRKRSEDDFVLYTGYMENEKEFVEFCDFIKKNGYRNIIAKVGRFRPNQPHRYDSILNVELASNNQYGVVVS